MACGQEELKELKLKAGLLADVFKAGPRGRWVVGKSYGQPKAASLEKVLRAFCFTCNCTCECSALLTHLSSKAGAEGKVKDKEKIKSWRRSGIV